MRLETERLVLQPWEERDREPLIALQCDPDVRRFFPDVPKAKYADKSEEATLGEMLNKVLAGLDQQASGG